MAASTFEVRLVVVSLNIDGLTRQVLARAQDSAGQTQCKNQSTTPHDIMVCSDSLPCKWLSLRCAALGLSFIELTGLAKPLADNCTMQLLMLLMLTLLIILILILKKSRRSLGRRILQCIDNDYSTMS